MIKLMPDMPPHVAAYQASGAISKEEYELVIKRVNEVANQYGHINFIVLLETDFENYSIGAFLEYLKVSFAHFTQWERMAIVSNEDWVRGGYKLLSPIVHGTIRVFKVSEVEDAKKWVSGPFEN